MVLILLLELVHVSLNGLLYILVPVSSFLHFEKLYLQPGYNPSVWIGNTWILGSFFPPTSLKILIRNVPLTGPVSNVA